MLPVRAVASYTAETKVVRLGLNHGNSGPLPASPQKQAGDEHQYSSWGLLDWRSGLLESQDSIRHHLT